MCFFSFRPRRSRRILFLSALLFSSRLSGFVGISWDFDLIVCRAAIQSVRERGQFFGAPLGEVEEVFLSGDGGREEGWV